MTTTAVSAPATRATWTVDAAHSSVEFAVRHLMIATARGRFAGITGTVILDEQEPSASTVAVTIDAASVDTREPQRDAHLRSADFFDVERFPTLAFRSTQVRALSPDRFVLGGDLTIRGVTRPVLFSVTSEGRTTDPWGHVRAGFSATATIKRSEFGLTWNQVLEAGGFAVGDEVKIAIDLEIVRN